MPVLICLRKELWTGLISVGDQVPTCPVFTRAKIKFRLGILINFPVTLPNINSFISTQLNGFKHRHVTQTIQFRNTVNEFQVLLINTYNSIQHYSFVSTELNGSKYCNVSLRIQLNIRHLFAHNLDVKEFYLTHRLDPVRYYYSGPERTWEQWRSRSTPHSPKLQDRRLTIK